MDYNLDNKKVLITGASGGIGTSLCEKFISTNCKIICTATSNEKIKILKNNYGSVGAAFQTLPGLPYKLYRYTMSCI